MPNLHILLAVAGEFRPEVADIGVVIDDAAFNKTVKSRGAGGLSGGIDWDNRVFIDFFRAGPIGPTRECTDFQFAINEKCGLAAAFEFLFDDGV